MARPELPSQRYEELLAEACERPFDADELKERLRDAQCAGEGRQLTYRVTRTGREYGSRTEVLVPTFRSQPALQEKVRRANCTEQLILLRQYAVWIQHGAPNNAPHPWLTGAADDDDCAVVPRPEEDVEFLEESIHLEAWKPGVLQPARLRPVKLEDGTFARPTPREIVDWADAPTVKMEPGTWEEPVVELTLSAADKIARASEEDDVDPMRNHCPSDHILEDPRDSQRRGLLDSQMEPEHLSELPPHEEPSRNGCHGRTQSFNTVPKLLLYSSYSSFPQHRFLSLGPTSNPRGAQVQDDVEMLATYRAGRI